MEFLKKVKKLFSSDSAIGVGHKAPDFALPNSVGQVVRLSNYFGKQCVILYFYPKDDTYGCIAESCSFRDHYEIFKEKGAEVIGISSDSPASHTQFSAKYKLPFVLLSDQKNEVRQLYQVPNTMGIIPGRVTFVIDTQGIIRHVFNSQFHPKSHVDQALAIIRQCNPCRGSSAS